MMFICNNIALISLLFVLVLKACSPVSSFQFIQPRFVFQKSKYRHFRHCQTALSIRNKLYSAINEYEPTVSYIIFWLLLPFLKQVNVLL